MNETEKEIIRAAVEHFKFSERWLIRGEGMPFPNPNDDDWRAICNGMADEWNALQTAIKKYNQENAAQALESENDK